MIIIIALWHPVTFVISITKLYAFVCLCVCLSCCRISKSLPAKSHEANDEHLQYECSELRDTFVVPIKVCEGSRFQKALRSLGGCIFVFTSS